MEPQDRQAQLQAKIDSLNKRIKVANTVYNSPDFKAEIIVSGSRCNDGVRFMTAIDIDFNTPEFCEFFNQYGARLIAEKMLLQHEVQLESVDVEQSQG